MWSDVQIHSIYTLEQWALKCLLSAFLNWFYGFCGSFGLSKMHHTPNFCPYQPRKNRMYQNLRVVKDLLSHLYTVFRSKKTFFYLLLDINWYLNCGEYAKYLANANFGLNANFPRTKSRIRQGPSVSKMIITCTSPNFRFYFLIKSLPQDFIKMTLYLILINSCTFFKCQRLRHLNNMTLVWPFYLQFR